MMKLHDRTVYYQLTDGWLRAWQSDVEKHGPKISLQREMLLVIPDILHRDRWMIIDDGSLRVRLEREMPFEYRGFNHNQYSSVMSNFYRPDHWLSRTDAVIFVEDQKRGWTGEPGFYANTRRYG